MDIKYFEYVIQIVECGSINKAAQNLQMLQPNLSVCIKNLEQAGISHLLPAAQRHTPHQ